jgi:hypothetical protein
MEETDAKVRQFCEPWQCFIVIVGCDHVEPLKLNSEIEVIETRLIEPSS